MAAPQRDPLGVRRAKAHREMAPPHPGGPEKGREEGEEEGERTPVLTPVATRALEGGRASFSGSEGPPTPTFAARPGRKSLVRRASAAAGRKLVRRPFTRVSLEVDLEHEAEERRGSSTLATRRGWLWKAREPGERWLHRWFVLKGNLAAYFEGDRTEDRAPKGAFLLSSCTAQPQPSGEGDPAVADKFCFDVETPERTYHLAAERHEEMEEWITAFEQASWDAHWRLKVAADRKMSRLEKRVSYLEQEEVKRHSRMNSEVLDLGDDPPVPGDELDEARRRTAQMHDLFASVLACVDPSKLGEEESKRFFEHVESFHRLEFDKHGPGGKPGAG